MTEVRAFRRVVLIIALMNLGYFGVEFAAALSIRSVSLMADSVDFLEDGTFSLRPCGRSNNAPELAQRSRSSFSSRSLRRCG